MSTQSSMPQTAEEAERMGLKHVPEEEMKATKERYPADPNQQLMGGLCYNGPCINGQMQICYFAGDGHDCTSCYYWPC